MPPRPPKRPPLAMKLWLSKRFRRRSKAEASSTPHGHAMSLGSLEHAVRGRVRTFLRHTWLVAFLGSAIIAGGVWVAFYFMTAPHVMRIAAGPYGAKVVQVLMATFKNDHDKIQLHLVPTDGPKQSALAIANGAADLAVLPSTLSNTLEWPVVAILRQNVMALIVPASPESAAPKKETAAPAKKEAAAPEKKEKPAKAGKNAKGGKAAKATAAKTAKDASGDKSSKAADSEDTDAASDSAGDSAAAADDPNKLDKVTKLAGRRIGVAGGGVATADLLNVVLDHYGVPRDKVQISPIDLKDLADAVKNHQIDAIFVAGSATGPTITRAVAAATQNGHAPGFIAIDQADGIAKRNAAFASTDIDAGTFGGNPPSPDDSLKSLSFPEYLVARKSFDRDAIATLTRLIYTSRQALAAGLPGEIKIEAPSTNKDAAVLVHPGALAYLNDDQKTFFDRYGDDIFYGLLIFPIFGSAIAGVAGYFRNTGRTRRLRVLQKVLDQVRKAHAAPSLEALDHLQVEVDHLVVAIIHQSEHEEYDETMQASFSLALDQARFAIAARRAVLLGQNGADSKVSGKFAAA